MTTRLFTLAETAAHLRHDNRGGEAWLRGWLRDHPPPAGELPYYLQAGGRRLFSAADIGRIEARMRALAQQRLADIGPALRAATRRRASAHAAPGPANRSARAGASGSAMMMEALRLARERPRGKIRGNETDK